MEVVSENNLDSRHCIKWLEGEIEHPPWIIFPRLCHNRARRADPKPFHSTKDSRFFPKHASRSILPNYASIPRRSYSIEFVIH
jgi:hypothetical protein